MTTKKALEHTAFPLILIMTLGLGHTFMSAGLSPSLTINLTFLTILAGVIALEQYHPYERNWTTSASDLKTDVAFYGVQLVTKAGPQMAIASLTLYFRSLNWVHLTSSYPSLLRVLTAFLVGDLLKYGLHRLSHSSPLLWKFHSVHHQAHKMNAANGLRAHPINIVWVVIPDLLSSMLFAVQGHDAIYLGLGRGALAILQHTNVKMKIKTWNRIFSTPDLHRWHHSIHLHEANSNYGASLSIWDQIFGSRFEKSGQPVRLGIKKPLYKTVSILGEPHVQI